MAAGGVMFCR